MNYVSNIDTICILVDVENYEKDSRKIINYLRSEKRNAKLEVLYNTVNKHFVTINDITFQLLPNSCKGYAFILKNDAYEIKIAQYRSKIDDFYPIQIRISSEYLWAKGAYSSWAIIYNWIVETFGNIIDDKVCRLDICSHISNVDFITNYDKVYKGKYKKTQVFHTGKGVNCLCFGSRKGKNIYCRIYNKTLEIQETKKKHWFREIWQNNGMNIEKVWNIEFEIKSELLRKYSLNHVVDILQHLQDIWKYCTTEWLIKVDRTNTRIERCPINKEWKELQNNYNEFELNGLIEREKQIDIDTNILMPNIVGGITSYSARKNNLDIKNAFENLYQDMIKYLKEKNKNFYNEVIKKQTTLEIKKEDNSNEQCRTFNCNGSCRNIKNKPF